MSTPSGNAAVLVTCRQVSDQESYRYGNAGFAKDIVRWTFQQTGQLEMAGFSHRLAETGETPATYRVKTDMVRLLPGSYSGRIITMHWRSRKSAPNRLPADLSTSTSRSAPRTLTRRTTFSSSSRCSTPTCASPSRSLRSATS